MPHQSARAIALAALREWHKGRQFSDAIIQGHLNASALGAPDRGFAIELFYGALRNLTLLDFWIDLLRAGKLDRDSRDLLRIGLYQLLLLQTPEHAAIYETVQLARAYQQALINGILRAAHRRKEELYTEGNAQALGIRASHPEFLVERWVKNFGANAAAALCDWNNRPAPVYARVNRLKIQSKEFLQTYPAARPLTGNPDFVEFNSIPSEALNRGLCYIQDPSTVIACQLLDPQPGETVLDACAAPGGKTGLLAQWMQNCGSIIACDRAPHRLARLMENLKRLGAKIATPTSHDWIHDDIPRPSPSFVQFDRILLDAPCSNTGVMRRRVDVRWRLKPNDFGRMQNEQLAVARAVVPSLKPGGVLVYSTCSLEPEENEQVVACLRAEFPNLKAIEQNFVTPFRDGFDGAFAAKLTRIS